MNRQIPYQQWKLNVRLEGAGPPLLFLHGWPTNGELWRVWSSDLFSNFSFDALLFFSGVAGVALNLSSFWCVSVTSATTYATVGALNKLPTTFVGVLILKEPLQPATAIYVTFGMFGGILYGYAKFQERKRAEEIRRKQKEEEDQHELLANKA